MKELLRILGKDPSVRHKLRSELTQKLEEGGRDLSEYGITISERKEERPEGEDCFRYLFGVHGVNFREILQTYFLPSDKPVYNGVVEYQKLVKYRGRNSVYSFKTTHLGIITNEGRVVSKWGPLGDVYEHEIDLIPTFYGSRVAFYAPVYTQVVS